MLIFQILIIFILLFMSAFFSGAETSLLKLSKIKIKHWIYAGKPHRNAWLNWISKPHELLTTILAGNTLVNIFISSVMAISLGGLFKDVPQSWVQTAAGGAAFFLTLIFGEVVPKIYCRQNSEKVAKVSLIPLYHLSKVLGAPFIGFLEWTSQWFPLLKESSAGLASSLTLDEIRAIVLDPNSLSGLAMEHREMMRKVLEMHQRTIQQVMVPWDRVDSLKIEEALEGGKSLERFIDRWIECGRTRIPVLSQKPSKGLPLLGYLYVKDLLSHILRYGGKIEHAQIVKWLHPLSSLKPEQKVAEVIEFFRFGSPIACVLDSNDAPLGIVTLEDLLEEFVGEILDEYDIQEKQP